MPETTPPPEHKKNIMTKAAETTARVARGAERVGNVYFYAHLVDWGVQTMNNAHGNRVGTALGMAAAGYFGSRIAERLLPGPTKWLESTRVAQKLSAVGETKDWINRQVDKVVFPVSFAGAGLQFGDSIRDEGLQVLGGLEMGLPMALNSRRAALETIAGVKGIINGNEQLNKFGAKYVGRAAEKAVPLVRRGVKFAREKAEPHVRKLGTEGLRRAREAGTALATRLRAARPPRRS